MVEAASKQVSRRGFTLVELMVVITIIVVLLSLLAPAMERSVYQAELATCGAHLNGIAKGAATYAMDHKRSYPYRGSVQDGQSKGLRMRQLTHIFQSGQHGNPAGYDDRPMLRPYVPMKLLVCPFTERIDLDSPEPNRTTIYAGYQMWFGWRYLPEDPDGRRDPLPGMMRLGDRFEWDNQRFDVVAGDHMSLVPFALAVESSHPDSAGVLTLQTLHDQEPSIAGVAVPMNPGGRMTVSNWFGSFWGTGVGTFELNFAHVDGSVRRHNEVQFNLSRNPSLSFVPMTIQENIRTQPAAGRSAAPNR